MDRVDVSEFKLLGRYMLSFPTKFAFPFMVSQEDANTRKRENVYFLARTFAAMWMVGYEME